MAKKKKTKKIDNVVIKGVSEEAPDGSFTMVWEYDGHDVPIEVRGPSPEQMDQFIATIAKFLWENRHLAKSEMSP